MRTPVILVLFLAALTRPAQADGLTITHDLATSVHGEVNATATIYGGELLYIRYSVSGLKVVDAAIALEPRVTITGPSGATVLAGKIDTYQNLHAFHGGTFADWLKIELPEPLPDGRYEFTVEIADLKSDATGTATGHFTLTNNTLAMRNLRFTSGEDENAMELRPEFGVGDFVNLHFRVTGFDAAPRIGTEGPMRIVFGYQIVDEKDAVVFENPSYTTMSVPVEALSASVPGSVGLKCSRPGRYAIRLTYTLARKGVTITGGAKIDFMIHPRAAAPAPK